MPNARLAGFKLKDKVGVRPVPDKPTDCGLPVPSLLKMRLADRAPAAADVKDTVTEHVAAGLSEAGQVLPVMLKSPAFAPPSAIELNVTGPVPVEVTVTDCVALVEPISVSGKLKLEGLIERVLVTGAGMMTSWLIV